jgi:epoxide hydrolase 4
VWRGSFVRGGDTRFYVRTFDDGRAEAGDGRSSDDLALLLHGWPEDGSSWAGVAPLLADAGYRVACPDLKGFGRSDAPRGGYDPATLADEISQLIQALGARKALLVGHDWGGAVALSTAFRHPGRVSALVTASSPFRQVDLRAAWHIPLLNLPVAPQLAFKLAGGPLTRATIRYAAVVTEPFDDAALARYAASVRASPRGWLSYYRRLSRRAVIDWGVRQVRDRSRFLASPDGPHRLRVPAVVVWGERDRVTPVELAGHVADDLGVDLVTVPGVGHFVHEEAPEAFARAILDLAQGDASVDAPAEGRA